MTLQQLTYVIQIAQCGSISMAAQRLFISQPALSKALADLEKEMGIVIFNRSSRGVYLSEEGVRFLSYARQVVEQAELLQASFQKNATLRKTFAVSSQHYAFVVNAFVTLVKEHGGKEYEFSLRESRTFDIIEDVRTQRSELGILFFSRFNKEVLLHILHNDDIEFVPLFTAYPHIFVKKDHPLAAKACVTLEELKPYPRLTYEQGIHNSFYFSEELHSTQESLKNIVVSDRATLFNLLIGLQGYTISSGILSSDLNGEEIISIPLVSEEIMEIGYIHTKERGLSALAQCYVERLKAYIAHYQKQI